jgi:hypothetical protein
MKPFKLLALIPVLAAIAGCAPGAYCEGELTYQRAPSVPPVQGVEGLQPRDSASALKVPPPPANVVPYAEGYVDEDGDEAVRCLDKPPALPPQALPPAPANEPASPAVEPKPEEKAAPK